MYIHHHHHAHQKIDQAFILSAVALLIGILVLSTGYYGNNHMFLLAGSVIVSAGVMASFFYLFFLRKT